MSAKGNKCCCGFCPNETIGTPTLREACDACGDEGPIYWIVSFPDGTNFANCCSTAATGLFLAYVEGADCKYQHYAGGGVCAGLTPWNWILLIDGQDPGDVTLTFDITFIGGPCTLVYTNLSTWKCLSSNILTLDVDASDCVPCSGSIPEELCIAPVGPCCIEHTDTLIAQFTNINDCPCVDGLEIECVWDNTVNRWIGSGNYCGDVVDVEIFCTGPTIPPIEDTDDLEIDLHWHSACTGDITVGMDDSFAFKSCDPVWARSQQFSTDGCCGSASSQIRIDIIQPNP